MGGCRLVIQSNNVREKIRGPSLVIGVTLILLLSSCRTADLQAPPNTSRPTPIPNTAVATQTSAVWTWHEVTELGVGFEYPAAYDPIDCGPRLIQAPAGTYDLQLGHRIHLYIEPTQASDAQSLGEQFIHNLGTDSSARVTARTSSELGGQPASRVEYRSGGTGRFAESTFVLYKGYSYRLDFSAGEFCDLPMQGISEGQVFGHMQDTLSFIGSK